MTRLLIRLSQLLCGCTVVAIIVFILVFAPKSSPSTALAAQDESNQSKSPAVTSDDLSDLQSQINDIIKQYPSLEMSVAVTDISSGNTITSGETAVFRAASITKVISACAFMHQVEQGTASLDTTIGGNTAQELIRQMLVNSDNQAWAAINDYLGRDAVQSYAQGIGLVQYDAYENTITASDQALLLSKIANGKLLNGVHTDLLYSYMQNTSNDELIPAGAPLNATVYHKYGYIEGNLHDGAIIAYKGKIYALVILTKNTTGTLSDYDSRTQLFKAITQAVTDYM